MSTIFPPFPISTLRTRSEEAEQVRQHAARAATQAATQLALDVTGQFGNGVASVQQVADDELPVVVHANNGEEQTYAGAERHFTNFTKGLAHGDDGFIKYDADFVNFAQSIRDDQLADKVGDLNTRFDIGDRVNNTPIWRYYNQAHDVYNAPTDDTPKAITLGEKVTFDLSAKEQAAQYRRWESPTAGVVFDLEGPDAYATFMPPAPSVVEGSGKDVCANPELIAEMAEMYWLALLRDTPLRAFDTVTIDDSTLVDATTQADVRRVQQAAAYLKALDFYQSHPHNAPGRRLRRTTQGGLDRNSVFRGQTAGDVTGPFLSQFLLLGTPRRDGTHAFNEADYTSGEVNYGAIRMSMKVRQAVPHKDYMTHWNEWLDVQNGADVSAGMQTYVSRDKENSHRFIATPRDLATYVHFDALYEAYLNACITLMELGAPTDPGFAHMSSSDTVQGFALFGGPHVLTMVTEVATRALKAVRFQKFNVHLRARPEVLAARIAYRLHAESCQGGLHEMPRFTQDVGLLAHALNQPVHVGDGQSINLLQEVAAHNAVQNRRHSPYLQGCVGLAGRTDLPLLPMAFPEGSPMHPSYGAGHATVAGACITMLKAFFDTSSLMVWDKQGAGPGQRKITFISPAAYEKHGDRYAPVAFVPSADGLKLDDVGYKLDTPLTLEGELNKLAANISIGRNMAGVHYYSDYIDSLRMGEHIALQILEQQAYTYRNDRFCFTVPTFDDLAHRQIVISAPKSALQAEMMGRELQHA